MMMGKQQRGATLVEAAMTVVTLFTLIMGITEFARAYNIRQNVTNAAREGARYAVAPDATTGTLPSADQIQGYVKPMVSVINAKGTVSVASTTHTINGVSVSYTQVTVSAPYQFVFFPFATVTISSQSEMRNETN